MSSVRVLLVDDELMVCAHLRTILGAAGDIEVTGEAHDGAEAVEAVLRLTPDVVLMDLRMPGVDGLTAIQRIAAGRRPPVIVALTTFDGDDHVLRALRAGAAGFLLKSTPPEELIGLVRVAAGGHTVMSPTATRRLLASANERTELRDRRTALIDELTGRERDVLSCLGVGESNAEIAARLYLTEPTVKGYVSRLMVKLQCTNRTQLGLLAQQTGVVLDK